MPSDTHIIGYARSKLTVEDLKTRWGPYLKVVYIFHSLYETSLVMEQFHSHFEIKSSHLHNWTAYKWKWMLINIQVYM